MKEKDLLDSYIGTRKRKSFAVKQIKAAFARQDNRCTKCHNPLPPYESDNQYQVHHHDANRQNNSDDNCEILHNDCHVDLAEETLQRQKNAKVEALQIKLDTIQEQITRKIELLTQIRKNEALSPNLASTAMELDKQISDLEYRRDEIKSGTAEGTSELATVIDELHEMKETMVDYDKIARQVAAAWIDVFEKGYLAAKNGKISDS